MGYIQGAALSSIEICWIFDLSNSVVRCVSDKQDNHHRGGGKETIDSFRMKYKKTNHGESSMLASQSIFLFYFPFFYLTFGFQFDIWPSVPRDLFDFSFLMGFPRDWIERNQSLSICFFFIYIKQSKTLFNAALHYINKVQKSDVFQNVSRVIFIYYYFFFLIGNGTWIEFNCWCMRASALCRAWKWICVTSAAMMNESRERGERRAIAQRPKSLTSTQVAAEAWGDCCV